MLRNDWTEARASDDTPNPLGLPLQLRVTADAVSRISRYADKEEDVAFNPVGQGVGLMNDREPVRDVILQIVEEYLDAVERLPGLQPRD